MRVAPWLVPDAISEVMIITMMELLFVRAGATMIILIEVAGLAVVGVLAPLVGFDCSQAGYRGGRRLSGTRGNSLDPARGFIIFPGNPLKGD